MGKDFDVIKSSITMTELCSFYGINIDRANKIKCMFHTDKTNSLKIYPESGGYYCFGCGESGSVIDFVMKYENVSNKEACVKLNEYFNLGLNLTGEMTDKERNEQRVAFLKLQIKKEKEKEEKELLQYQISRLISCRRALWFIYYDESNYAIAQLDRLINNLKIPLDHSVNAHVRTLWNRWGKNV